MRDSCSRQEECGQGIISGDYAQKFLVAQVWKAQIMQKEQRKVDTNPQFD